MKAGEHLIRPLTVLGLTLALLAVATGAPAKAATIYHQQQLPIRSGQLETVKVTCPKGYIAVGGTTGTLPLDVRLVKTASRDDEQIFLLSPAGYGPTTVTLIVTCVKRKRVVRVGGRVVKFAVGLKFNTSKTKSVKVKKGAIIELQLECPKGSAPGGLNLGVSGGAAPRRAAANIANTLNIPTIDIFRSMPMRGGWDVGAIQLPPDTDEAELTGSVNCIGRRARREGRGRRASERITILRRLSHEMIIPGLDESRLDCRSGSAPLSPGYDLTSSDRLTPFGAFPNDAGNGFVFRFANGDTKQLPGTAAGLCLVGEKRLVLHQ